MEITGRREAIVACSDKHMSAGISVWDVESGEAIMHIPTCASPPHGLLCLRNHFLVASQLQRHGSYGGGAIFIWPLAKPQALHRSYPIEPIGPIACTKDGSFLFGGAPSGNAYVWEASSGRLLKNWRAHHKSVSCLALSSDDSLLISGSDDGVINVWNMIRFSNTWKFASFPLLARAWSLYNWSFVNILWIKSGSDIKLLGWHMQGLGPGYGKAAANSYFFTGCDSNCS